MVAVAISLACIVALLNAVATARILRSDLASRRQKTWQLLFVWIVPVLGAILALAVASDDRGRSGSRRPGEPGTTLEMGVILGGNLSGSSHHSHSHDSYSGPDSSFGGHS